MPRSDDLILAEEATFNEAGELVAVDELPHLYFDEHCPDMSGVCSDDLRAGRVDVEATAGRSALLRVVDARVAAIEGAEREFDRIFGFTTRYELPLVHGYGGTYPLRRRG